MNTNHSARNINIDYLRVIATIFVVLIHITIPAISRRDSISSFQWWLVSIMDVFTLTAVPIFVMISGAMLLKSTTKTFKDFYSKRFSRIFVPSVFYVAVYMVWSLVVGYETSIKTYLIKTIIYGNPYTHLYFLFVIAGLYVLTPWLSKMLAALTSKELRTLTGLLLLLTSIWQLGTVWVTQSFVLTHLSSVTMFLPYLGYFIAGHYLFTYHKQFTHRSLLLLLLLVTAGIIIFLEYYLLNRFGLTPRGVLARDYQFPLVMIMSMLLFNLVITLPNLKATAIVMMLSNYSFGVYLVHQLVLDIVQKIIPFGWFGFLPLEIAIKLLITVWVSFLVTWLLSKIPMIGKVSGKSS